MLLLGMQNRKNLMKEFQEGDCKVLVCTDIASRGIDTSKVSYAHVVLAQREREKSQVGYPNVSYLYACANLVAHINLFIIIPACVYIFWCQFTSACPTTHVLIILCPLQVNHIVLFDFPLNLPDYLHRVGRTGRVGSQVVRPRVTAFMTHRKDMRMALEIRNAASRQEAVMDKKVVRAMQRERIDQTETKSYSVG